MIKKILLIMVIAIIGFSLPMSANKAYKTISETHLYELNEKGGIKQKLCPIEKGDTVYATAETDSYIAENEGNRLRYIPVEYGGRKGMASFSALYPIKLSPTDTLRYVHDSAIKDRTAAERFLVPAMDRAINITPGPATWLIAVLITLACAILFVVLGWLKSPTMLWLYLAAVSLVAVSASEIMFILSFHQHVLWFILPSQVGGWGHTILNFLLMAIIVTAQGLALAGVWFMGLSGKNSHREGDEIPIWLTCSALWAVPLGLALIVINWCDKGDIPASTYLITFGTLLIPAICGAVYGFMHRRFTEGIVFPLMLVAGSLGLACSVMILGMVIILVVVVAVVVVILGGAALSFLGTALGMERTKIVTDDGRVMGATKNLDGTVTGDDGNKYKIR